MFRVVEQDGAVSIPKRVHRPFSRASEPRKKPFACRFNPQTGSSAFQPGIAVPCAARHRGCFNPQTGSSAFQPQYPRGGHSKVAGRFQSPNGFIGLSAGYILPALSIRSVSFNPQTGSSAFQPTNQASRLSQNGRVSIPKRVHRPFSPGAFNCLMDNGPVSIPKRVHRPFSL